MLKITGTFIDEVTRDIPAHNWGQQEWAKEFDTFIEAGLDTLVLIRAGYGERLAFPSNATARAVDVLPVYKDMVELFMDAANRRGLSFFFGLYDSGYYWHRYDWRTGVEINRQFAREAWERYGHHRSFKGWYLPHETPRSNARIIDINTALAATVTRGRQPSRSHIPVLAWPP